MLLTMAPAFAQEDEPARVRVAHHAEGIETVDVFVDGELSDLQRVEFGAVTDYVELPAGAYTFGIGAADSKAQDATLITRIAPGSYTTLTAAASAEQISLSRADETATLRIFHNSEAAGSVDVFINGEVTDFQGLNPGVLTDSFTIPAGAYTFGIGAASSETPDATLITRLTPGSRAVIAANDAGESGTVQLAKLADVALIRVAHHAAGVGAVGVSIDGAPSEIQGVAFSSQSDYAEIPSGTYSFGVAETGGDASFTDSIQLLPGTEATITAFVQDGQNQLRQTSRAIQPPNPAYVRVAHNGAGIDALDFYVDGALTELQGIGFGSTSDFIALPSNAAYSLGIGAAGGGSPDVNLITRVGVGSYTTVNVQSDGGQLRLAPANLTAHVRVGHFAAGVDPIDVGINGAVSGRGLTYGELTEWVAMPSGAVSLSIGSSVTVQNLQPGSWTTIIARPSINGSQTILQVINENFANLAADLARFTMMNAVPGGDPLNLQLTNGRIAVQNLAFPGAAGDNDGVYTFDIPPGAYDFQVTPAGFAGTVVASFEQMNLSGGAHYFIVAYGSANAPSISVAATDPAG
jgi:hypothetical protein